MAKKKDSETTTVSASDLESADLKALSAEQVKSLSTEQVGKLSTEQVRSLTPEQFSALSNEQILALSAEQQNALTPEQKTRLDQARSGTPTQEQKKEALNPEEVNLAPGYNPATDPGPGVRLHEKVPHYGPGAMPQAGTTRYAPPVGQGTTDTRVPPENVSVTTAQEPAAGPTSAARGAQSNEPAPGQQPPSQPKEPDANTISLTATPADVGLPRPELIAGRSPLPEEDPTPSIVPIPPPGPRRVA